jgi:hypothetical protein
VPGEYTLSASYRTTIYPAPKGAPPLGKQQANAEEIMGGRAVTLTSAPVKIKVQAK